MLRDRSACPAATRLDRGSPLARQYPREAFQDINARVSALCLRVFHGSSGNRTGPVEKVWRNAIVCGYFWKTGRELQQLR